MKNEFGSCGLYVSDGSYRSPTTVSSTGTAATNAIAKMVTKIALKYKKLLNFLIEKLIKINLLSQTNFNQRVCQMSKKFLTVLKF